MTVKTTKKTLRARLWLWLQGKFHYHFIMCSVAVLEKQGNAIAAPPSTTFALPSSSTKVSLHSPTDTAQIRQSRPDSGSNKKVLNKTVKARFWLK